jgi:hypothetical protein
MNHSTYYVFHKPLNKRGEDFNANAQEWHLWPTAERILKFMPKFPLATFPLKSSVVADVRFAVSLVFI